MVLLRLLAAFDQGSKQVPDLRIGIVGVVDVSRSPLALVEHQASQAVRTSGSEARVAANEAFVANGNLQEVFGKSPGFEIIVVGLADTSEEAHRSRPAKAVSKDTEHEALGLEDLFLGVAVVDHVNNLLDGRAVDLFILGSKEESSGANQLELSHGNHLGRQEAVNVIDGKEEGLGQ